MPDNTTLTTAGTLSAQASKRLAAIQAHITCADAARSDAEHPARAAKVVDAATTAAAANRAAATAWEALATHAVKQALNCRRGAEVTDRTRNRWACQASSGGVQRRPVRFPVGGVRLPDPALWDARPAHFPRVTAAGVPSLVKGHTVTVEET